MQTMAIRTVTNSLPENEVILLTLLISKRYIPYTDLRKICGITTEFRQNYKKGNPRGGLPPFAQTPPTSTGGTHQIQDAGKQLPADPAVSFLAEKRPDIKKEQATPAEGWENSSGTFLKKLQHFFRKALHVSEESPTFAPAIEKQK